MSQTNMPTAPARPRRGPRWWVWLAIPLLIGTVLGIAAVQIALHREPEFYLRAARDVGDVEVRRRAAAEFEQRTTELSEGLEQPERATTVTFSQQQINSWIAEEFPGRDRSLIPEGIGAPLVEIDAGVIRIGSHVDVPQFEGVVSIELRPCLESESRLVIVLGPVRAGSLLIPAGRWIETVRARVAEQPGIELREQPVLQVVADLSEIAQELRGIELTELTVAPGEITVAGQKRSDP